MAADALLLERGGGDNLLLETGFDLLLESSTAESHTVAPTVRTAVVAAESRSVVVEASA